MTIINQLSILTRSCTTRSSRSTFYVVFILEDKRGNYGEYINRGVGVVRDQKEQMDFSESLTLAHEVDRGNGIPKEREVDKRRDVWE